MVKNRKNIPKAIKETVLKEFCYRCAVCGTDNPHLHHIDEDPSNNDKMNLIPLCPNCHLIDQHDPTQPIEPLRLGLFRKYKDPHILKPQFLPLFNRFRYLFSVSSGSDAYKLSEKSKELVDFIKEMEMGTFYANKISKLLEMVHTPMVLVVGNPESEKAWQETHDNDCRDYLSQIEKIKDQAIDLIIENLRYQSWK